MEKSKIITNTFPVAGMSCASCAVRVDKALNGLPGVESAHVNYASATARVDYRPGECSPGVLKRAVQAAGYDLLTDAEGRRRTRRRTSVRRITGRSNGGLFGRRGFVFRLWPEACCSWTLRP